MEFENDHRHFFIREEVGSVIPEDLLIGWDRGKFSIEKKVGGHIDFPLEVRDGNEIKRRGRRDSLGLSGKFHRV